MVRPESLWPTGELGGIVRAGGIPSDFVSSINNMSDEQICGNIGEVQTILGESFSWGDSSIRLLLNRRDNISALVEEVWQ